MRRVLVLAISLAACSRMAAQDPFGGAPAPAGQPGGQVANPFAPAGAGPQNPFGGAVPAPKPKTPAAKPAGDQLPPLKDERDPVVLAVRESNPTTPQDLMFAVRTLFERQRAVETKYYLRKLLATRPDRDTLVGFQEEFGSEFFLRFARDAQLEPEGGQLAKMVQQAAYSAARDPDRLRGLVRQLSDPSFVVRQGALDGLRRADTAAVAFLLEALADPGRAAEHPQVRAGLVELGKTAIDPLLGAVDAPDEALRGQVMTVLGEFQSARAIPFLVGPYVSPDSPPATRRAAGRALMRIVGQVPTQFDVEQYLYRRAKAFYEGAPPARVDYQGRIEMWRWDAQRKTCVAQRYPAADASLMMAARLAKQLFQVAPDRPEFRRLFLLTNLQFAKNAVGLDQPLPRGEGTAYAAACAAGADAVEELLAYAIEKGHVTPAMAAAEILADLAGREMLDSDDGRPRPLAAALRHGDLRVRMTAAEAIMRIDPQRPYAGSSYLLETFGYVIRTLGTRRVLIAHPRVEKSQSLVGMLGQLGFEADAARTGREAFLLAANNPDYDFVLLSDAIDYPDANQTVQMLRHDPRTSRLVVGIMAREHNVDRAARWAELDPLLESFPRAHNAEMMAYQIGRLIQVAGRNFLTYDQRLRFATAAMDHLVYLAEHADRYAFYDLYRQREAVMSALSVPELSAKAATVLGHLGSAEAQRALVGLVNQNARPLDQRQAAAKAFALAVEHHGLLLTREEILRQYDRYNQSETLDPGTQQVLGAVLDAIELPSKRAQQEQTAKAS